MRQWIYEWYQTIRIMMNRKLYRELRDPIDTAQIVRNMRNEDNHMDDYQANRISELSHDDSLSGEIIDKEQQIRIVQMALACNRKYAIWWLKEFVWKRG